MQTTRGPTLSRVFQRTLRLCGTRSTAHLVRSVSSHRCLGQTLLAADMTSGIDMDADAQMFRNKTRLDQLQRVIGLRGAEAFKRLRRANRPSLGQGLREGEGGQTKLAFSVKQEVPR